MKKTNAGKMLASSAKIYSERAKQYKDTFMQVGNVLQALFPAGIELKTPEDHARWHILTWVAGKLCRYANNWGKGGHDDSIADATTYSAILRALDTNIENKVHKS